jgi:hypothetical protein
MDDDAMTPDGVDGEQVVAEFERQLARVGVDWSVAVEPVFEMAPKVENPLPDGDLEVGVMLDITSILATLESLPDGAGTNAFVTAYRQRQGDTGTPRG